MSGTVLGTEDNGRVTTSAFMKHIVKCGGCVTDKFMHHIFDFWLNMVDYTHMFISLSFISSTKMSKGIKKMQTHKDK